jgi:hypothetical protein
MRVIEPNGRRPRLRMAVPAVALLAISEILFAENAADNELAKLLIEESKAWSVLTYSQLYIYDKKDPFQYTGTVFLQINSFAIHDCELKLGVEVQDKFVAEDERPQRRKAVRGRTTPISNTFHYSYALNLKDVDPRHIDTVFTRPRQLDENTRLTCHEEPTCNISWLRVTTIPSVIKEQRILNGFLDVNQVVNEMLVPITSNDRALQLALALHNSALACH